MTPPDRADEWPATLSEILHWRGQREPRRVAYIFLADGETQERSLTYGELDMQARAVEARLEEVCDPGSRALLLFSPGLDFIAAFFGCLYAGVIPVPACPPRHRRQFDSLGAIASDSRPSAVLTTDRMRVALEPDALLPDVHRIAIDDGKAAGRSRVAPAVPHTIALLQYTSGSTKTPRGVEVTQKNLVYNLAFIKHAFGLSRESVSVSWLPHFHDMGLIEGILQPAYAGFLGVLMPSAAFVQRPGRWLEAFSRYGGTHGGAPNFAYELCCDRVSPEAAATLDLSKVDSMYVAAEPIQMRTVARFIRRFEQCGLDKNSFFAAYGLAEATLMVSGERGLGCVAVSADDLKRGYVCAPSDSSERAAEIVCCGHDVLETSISIVNPDSLKECAEGTVGEIWVGGPSVCKGYWGRPTETRQVFEAQLAGTSTRYLRTGDLGFKQDGKLFLTGRLKELIIIHGKNHYPQDIEWTAEEAHASLRKNGGAAFAVESPSGECLVLVHEAARQAQRNFDVTLVASSVARAIAENHGVRLTDFVVIKIGTLPRTTSGKVQRARCRRLYLDGHLDVVDRWPGIASLLGSGIV